jgi:hypothetical protein
MILNLADIHTGITTVEGAVAYFSNILLNNYTNSFPWNDRLGNAGQQYHAQTRDVRNNTGQRYRIFELALPIKPDALIVARRPWLHIDEIEPNSQFPAAFKNANL